VICRVYPAKTIVPQVKPGSTQQVTQQVTRQVAKLLDACVGEQSRAYLMLAVGIKDRVSF